MSTSPAYCDVFLVIRDASSHISDIRDLGRGLNVYLSRILVGTDLYFRKETDVALVCLRIDVRHATQALIKVLAEGASRVGVSVLEPARLPEAECRQFRSTYLSQYEVRVPGLDSVEDAARALEEHLEGMGVMQPPRPTQPAERLECRFLRGDEWALARAQSLNRDSISVTTGGPPRSGDVVELALLLMRARVAVVTRCAVVHVTPTETASTLGAAGFSGRFLVADGGERRRLDEFLERVAAARVPALAPPPRRREVRYPVRWPVCLGTVQGTRTTSALDVSRHGMFVAAERPLVSGPGRLNVLLPLDDAGAPLRATARVARTLAPQMAAERGVHAGFGLELDALSRRDEGRYLRFLQRVDRRCQRRVVVGAEARRATLIVAELMAAGYYASSASDAPTFVAKAAAASRPPDLVLIDATLTQADARAQTAVSRALAARQVPTLHIDEETPSAARSLADVALLG